MPSYERQCDLNLSTEVVQKHLKWAQPFAGGTLKVFFVPDAHAGREIMELIQRMDICYESVTIDRNWMFNCWGLGDFYNEYRSHLYDYSMMYQNLENAMCSNEHFDVLVLPEIKGWGEWTEKTRQAILKRVEEGAGLVLIKPYLGKDPKGNPLQSPELEALSPLIPIYNEGYDEGAFPVRDLELQKRAHWQIAQPHYITDSFSFDLIPFEDLSYYPYRAEGDVLIEAENGDPILAVKPYGHGRVVTAAWYPRNILPQHADMERYRLFESIVTKGNTQATTYNYLEYFYGLVFRSMVWAAGKEPDARIKLLKCKEDTIKVEVENAPAEAMLSLRVLDAWDEIVYEAKGSINDAFVLPEWLRRDGGEWRADVFLKQSNKVIDWRTLPMNFPRKAQIDSLYIDKEQYDHGDTVKICAQVSDNGNGCEIEMQLSDCFGRVLFSARKPVLTGKICQEYTIENWPSINIWPYAEVWCEGRRIQRVRCKPSLVCPGYHRHLSDFEAFMSAGQRGHGDLWDLQRIQSWNMGITGAHPGTTKVLRNAGAKGFGVTFYGRAPYVKRRDKYVETHDKNYLIRKPCLNDPQFWEKTSKSVRESLKKSAKYMPVAYFACDEGSLTCYTDELDFCFSPYCISKMREWLQEKYGSLEALNKRWKRSYTNWDQVVPDTYLEAVERNEFAAWGDHRLFMENTFAGAYKELADLIKEQDPEGVVRMSGCQASTAYSGYDYYQLHQYIGYFEAYGVGNQYEYHRSFKRPGTILGGWFGYGQKGTTVKHSLWKAFFHELTLISVFWEISNLNPDFTLFKGAQDMGEVFKELRRQGIGKLLLYNAKRDNLGIAVHYSMPSIHASYTDDRHVFFEENRQGWLDILEDLGYQYDFVSSQEIEAGKLLKDGFRILILPFSRAISQQEEDEIRKFVKAGGMVIADFQCGIMDESCGRLKKGRLDDVFGITRYSSITHHFFCDRGENVNKDFPYFRLRNINPLKENYKFPMHEPDIRLAGGQAALTQALSKALPAVVVNRYGDGFGVYLNSSMKHYVEERKSNTLSRSLEVMRNVMRLNGLRKPIEVLDVQGNPVENGLECIYYSKGKAQYVGLLRGLGQSLSIVYDGRETGDLESSDDKTIYTIKLTEVAHIYDVRTGCYLGYGGETQIKMNPGDAAILAFLPYPPPVISMEAPDVVRAGEWVRIIGNMEKECEIAVDSVWNMQVYQPDGTYDMVLSKNFEGENLVCKIQIPYNASIGNWRIVLRDVATGVSKEKMILVKAAK